MKSIQEVFDRLLEMKKDQKEYKNAYKDALDNMDNYRDIVEQIKNLREKKKQIETSVKNQLGGSYVRLEEIKYDIKSEKDMLADAAITALTEGKIVEVKDEYGNIYEPVWSVKFKKSNSL